jgi:predicted  nucleic acid-binding Zn-ribbon protein
LKTQIEDAKRKLEEAKKEMDSLNGQDVKLTAEIRELRAKEEEITSQLQASKSQNKILNALMKEKAKGKIVGIYVRLNIQEFKSHFSSFLNIIRYQMS